MCVGVGKKCTLLQSPSQRFSSHRHNRTRLMPNVFFGFVFGFAGCLCFESPVSIVQGECPYLRGRNCHCGRCEVHCEHCWGSRGTCTCTEGCPRKSGNVCVPAKAVAAPRLAAAAPNLSDCAYIASCTDNFSPDRELGRGVFGTVYLGVDPNNSMEFAAKRSECPDARQREIWERMTEAEARACPSECVSICWARAQ